MPGNIRSGGSVGSQKPPHAVPTRAMSLDSLHDKHANLDQKIQEYLPTRTTRTTPKVNQSAMQFVKTGPASLYKSATEQIKKAEEVKELRKTLVTEETDWQENLDKWKSSRRKRLQPTVESIIQIKKNEQDEELSRMRRKSKTFSQIQEDKTKRGRKYNLAIHNDDDNDLSSLGLAPSKGSGSLTDGHDDPDTKDLDQDNKDAKSDAGFCTGSDTGSDGVFAEDNISDTSSALGDKKEAHDSLLDTGGSKEEEPHINGHGSSLITEVFASTSTSSTTTIHTAEYTYDKAIAGYKQYAENSAKKRTSSITSLNSNTSHKDDDKKDDKIRMNGRSPSPSKSSKLEEKVSFFSKEVDKESRISPEPRVVMREKSPKVNINQRRSMFENVDLTMVNGDRQQKQANRRSLDISNSLRNKVASFENLDTEVPSRVRGTTPHRETNLRSKVASYENLSSESTRVRSITPTRDTNFQVKRATFVSSEPDALPVKKKTPERDMNFHKKLASFNAFESESKVQERRVVPQRDPGLRKKIASYEQLEQAAEPRITSPREEVIKSKDRSMSLENLDEPQVEMRMRPAHSMMNIMRRAPSTPYMEVELESSRSEQECVMETQSAVSCGQESSNVQEPTKRSTVYETFEKCQVSRDVESAPLYSIFQYLSPEVNAEVFEIASKLEETPILGSPIHKVPSTPLPTPQPAPTTALPAPLTPTPAPMVTPVPAPLLPPTPAPMSLPLEEDSLEATKQYTDEDINEVDGEPSESQDGEEEEEEHHYQTLEEVLQEAPTSRTPHPEEEVRPSLPPTRMPHLEAPEVLDVTWTDGPSQAAPPSEPPPPPPPDDDSDSDSSEQPQSLPAQEEDAFKRENSTRRLKKELWRRRSDFLGTSSSYVEEEQTVKPPPDLSDLLRQEREVERSLLGSRVSKSLTREMLSEAEIARREREIIENLERSEQLKQQQTQQVWDNPQGQETAAGDLDDHLQYQEVMNLQTASELDTGPKVALIVPVTSTNLLESPHSGLEHAHLLPQGVDNAQATLESTLSIEEKHAEVLNNHIVEAQPIMVPSEPQIRTATHTTAVTESPLLIDLGEPNSDHLLASSTTLDYCTSSVASARSQPDEYKKLAELEEEMLRHDKDMLRRVGHLPDEPARATLGTQRSSLPPLASYAEQGESAPSSTFLPQSTETFQRQQPPSNLPIQEFYTAPTYESVPPAEEEGSHASPREDKNVELPEGSPSQYTALASPHPFSRSNSHSTIETNRHTPLQSVRSTPLPSPRDSLPEPLPRKKKVVSPMTPSKAQKTLPDLNTAERMEAMRVSRMTSTESMTSSGEQVEAQGSAAALSGQQMSKSTLLALSAIPKPKLTENESWIKKKQEGQKRDYSKHWLHQEAEQRRLEQQDRISRQKYQAPQPQRRSPQSVSPQFPSPQHSTPPTTSYLPTQNNASIFPHQNASPTYSTYPQALRNPSPSHGANTVNNNIANNNSTATTTSNNSNTVTANNNSSWRNQATTYQPHVPAPAVANGDKALPDSIIHNLTQRINNKNGKNTYSSPSGRAGTSYANSNYRDENYHDYMNADALSSASGNSPLYQSGQPSPPSSQQPDAASQQDQRLLSVSGKKKCSHCSEELGRGAAMIIESLRLFYHIPCFKCCVCGIQLGNGSAGADVRVRNHKLHCHNCYSNDEGMKFSKV